MALEKNERSMSIVWFLIFLWLVLIPTGRTVSLHRLLLLARPPATLSSVEHVCQTTDLWLRDHQSDTVTIITDKILRCLTLAARKSRYDLLWSSQGSDLINWCLCWSVCALPIDVLSVTFSVWLLTRVWCPGVDLWSGCWGPLSRRFME